MRTVERLLTFSAVEIRAVDPRDPDARQCIRAYFAELDRRSESGFDPGASIPAEPHQLTPPAGCFLIAYLRDEPVGCGGVKYHPGEPSELKRLWVSEQARGLGIGRRLIDELEALAAAERRLAHPAGHQPDARGGHRDVPVDGDTRSSRVQRRGVRPPLVREDAVGRVRLRSWT